MDESKTGLLFVFIQHFHKTLKEAMEIDFRQIIEYEYSGVMSYYANKALILLLFLIYYQKKLKLSLFNYILALFRIILKLFYLRIIKKWWWPEVESNHRHADFQSAALPTELSGHGLGIFYRKILN